jgi:hypothetical protein
MCSPTAIVEIHYSGGAPAIESQMRNEYIGLAWLASIAFLSIFIAEDAIVKPYLDTSS